MCQQKASLPFPKGAVLIVGGPTLSVAHPTPHMPQQNHTDSMSIFTPLTLAARMLKNLNFSQPLFVLYNEGNKGIKTKVRGLLFLI